MTIWLRAFIAAARCISTVSTLKNKSHLPASAAAWRRFFVCVRQKDFVVVRWQNCFRADELQQGKIIFDGVLVVILRDRFVHQQPIQPARVVVMMADPRSRANDTCDDAIRNPALRMRVKR